MRNCVGLVLDREIDENVPTLNLKTGFAATGLGAVRSETGFALSPLSLHRGSDLGDNGKTRFQEMRFRGGIVGSE
jgi:hypothetical protein